MQHPLVQRPLPADKALGPWTRRRDDLKHVRSRSRHDRDDAFRVGEDARALGGHGLEEVAERHGLAWIAGCVIEEPRHQATDRLVDGARLLTGRRWPGSRLHDPVRRLLRDRFGHSYTM